MANDREAMTGEGRMGASTASSSSGPQPSALRPQPSSSSRILFAEVEEWEIERILNAFGDDARLIPEPLSEKNASAARDARILSTFIYSMIDKPVLDAMPDLRMIATRSTGFEHIDLDECARRGIVVSYVPRYGDVTVAEHTFALILALAKHIVESADRTRRGEFDFRGLRGFELAGKTIAIVGAGKIGLNVARIARGFCMAIIAFDKYPNQQAAAELGMAYLPYDDLLRQADVVTYHVPESPETHHMLNENNIGLLKPNCLVINTARGSVIETRALVRAISEGKVRGAGLDVLEEEPVVREERELVSSLFQQKHNLQAILSGQILLRLNNVLITPHNAFNTDEAVLRILDTTISNIQSFVAGQPINLVPAPVHV